MTTRIPHRGFTLIELLVVIAIIGVLSSILVSSLSTARAKGADAVAKSDMVNGRSQAEIFYAKNGDTYVSGTADICAAGALANVDSGTQTASVILAVAGPPPPPTGTIQGVNAYVLAAAQAEGLATVSLAAAGGPGIAVCNSSATAYAAEVPIKTPRAGFYCIDSKGVGTTSPTTLIASGADTSC